MYVCKIYNPLSILPVAEKCTLAEGICIMCLVKNMVMHAWFTILNSAFDYLNLVIPV